MSQIIELFPEIQDKHYFQDPETGEFWFNATGVCTALGFANVSRTLGMYTDEDERFQEVIKGRVTWYVSEAGCYGLAMAAKTDAAKKFKRWLKHDVLPKLRADGYYILQKPSAAQEVNYKHLVGTWQEERELRKVPRKRFNSVVHKYTGSQDKREYAKYSNKIYQGLFGCNAETLRNLPVVAGVKTIGRNHIPEAFEIAAVGEAEELVSDLFDNAEAIGYSLSLTRTIVFACFMVKKAFTIPHLGKSQSKATVIYQMLSKPSNKEIQYYLEGLKDEYDF